jgi:uncharacterized membrane protein YdbT with pleckstrin-like domain
MGYIEKHLLTGERVVYRAKLHWVIFKWPIFFLLVSLPCFFGRKELVYAGAGLVALALLLVIGPAVRSAGAEFGVTNKRLVAKTGMVRRDTIELLLTKVEAIQVRQTIMGRLLNYGTLIVTGTGGSKDEFLLISDPLTFRKNAQEQIAAIQGL